MRQILFGNKHDYDYNTKEAFNSFRTNLKFCGADIKTVLLTSCTPDEGKSITTMSIAKSLAEDGKRVLFIDADLRKSRLVGVFKMESEGYIKGLSHYLSGQATVDEVIFETSVDNLSICLAGPTSPNPTELLGGSRFEMLLAYGKERFDMVVIDTPPLGSVIDALVIAPQCDGVILLIESDIISYRFARDIKQQLEFAGCRILGAALNKVPVEKHRYRGYYKKGYYKGYYNRYYGYTTGTYYGFDKDKEKNKVK